MFHFLSRITSPTPSKLVFSLRFITTTSKPKDTSFALSYLIDTCGLSPQRAASLSKYFSFATRDKPDSVIEFFKSQGFSQKEALGIISKQPCLLRFVPKTSFKPKIDFFKSRGLSDSEILKLLNGWPNILAKSLQNEIIPSFDLFSNMFRSRDKFLKTVIRYSGILCEFGSQTGPNLKLLREEGVPESHIVRFIQHHPRSLKIASKTFKDKVEQVKELRIDPLTMQFLIVLHVKVSLSKSTWARKLCIYRRWGWSDDDTGTVFRIYPWCMSTSEDKIDGIMDFLVNKLGCESSDIAKYPSVLGMSLEKRIIPRGSVFLVLMSKGVVSQPKLHALYNGNEKDFLDRFIFCYEQDGGELLKLYKAKLALARRSVKKKMILASE